MVRVLISIASFTAWFARIDGMSVMSLNYSVPGSKILTIDRMVIYK